MRSAEPNPFAGIAQAWHSIKARHRGFLAQSWTALAAALMLLAASQASGQTRPEAGPTPMLNSARANAGTLGVISGGADGTYIRIAADLANVLDSEDLRILPMIGRGSLQNLRDIMFLRGVDIGIVQMDALEGLRSEGLQDRALQRLRYIARLYNEEVHLLAKRDITDIRQLEGKKVNIDKAGSGSNLTARIIFEKLKIKPVFTTVDQTTAFEQLRAGTIDAALYVAGRPVRVISEFQGDGFHLLPIPYEGEIAETYLPTRLTDSDYPRLVDSGQAVDTLAVGSVLAAFNWPVGSDRYRRIDRFVNAFFSNFESFQKPGRHPKWKEVNLSATVPGWERAKPAQDWLDRQAAPEGDQSRDFEAFMNARGGNLSPTQRERLFREFQAWQKDQARARASAGGAQ